MLSTERVVRSARFLSCWSLSLLIVRAKSTGMEVNRDFTSKETGHRRLPNGSYIFANLLRIPRFVGPALSNGKLGFMVSLSMLNCRLGRVAHSSYAISHSHRVFSRFHLWVVCPTPFQEMLYDSPEEKWRSGQEVKGASFHIPSIEWASSDKVIYIKNFLDFISE